MSLIHMPSAIAAKLEETNTYVLTLGRDFAAAQVPAGLLAAWSDFAREWSDWYASEPSTYWGSTWDTCEEYQRRAEGFREQLVAAGGTPWAPPDASPDDPLVSWQSSLFLVLLVVGAAFAFGAGKSAGAK